MTDTYYSRMLALARQNKGIKFIKNIKDNQIEVEYNNGRSDWLDWDEVMNFGNVLESTQSQNK